MNPLALLEGLTVWHWIGLGVILLTLEVAVGTFDLLWIAMGAFLTAFFAWIIPPPAGGWQGQLVFFGIVAVAFLLAGRTFFKGLRRAPDAYPNLNDRTAGMVGQRGEAATTFEGREGKVKIGDTVWLAKQANDVAIAEGDAVVVAGAEGTTLRVKRA